jgi:hypothetical protein
LTHEPANQNQAKASLLLDGFIPVTSSQVKEEVVANGGEVETYSPIIQQHKSFYYFAIAEC